MFRSVSYINDFNTVVPGKREAGVCVRESNVPEQVSHVGIAFSKAAPKARNDNRKRGEHDSLMGMLCFEAFLGASLMEMANDALTPYMPETLQDATRDFHGDWAMAIEAYDEYRTDRLKSRQPDRRGHGRRADQGGTPALRGPGMYGVSVSSEGFFSSQDGAAYRNEPGYHAGLDSWLRAAKAAPRL